MAEQTVFRAASTDVAVEQPPAPVLADPLQERQMRRRIVGMTGTLHSDAELDDLAALAALWLDHDEIEPDFCAKKSTAGQVDASLLWLTGDQSEVVTDEIIAEGWYVGSDTRLYASDPAKRGLDIRPHRLYYYILATKYFVGLAGSTAILEGELQEPEQLKSVVEPYPDLELYSDDREAHQERLHHIRRGIIAILARNHAL